MTTTPQEPLKDEDIETTHMSGWTAPALPRTTLMTAYARKPAPMPTEME